MGTITEKLQEIINTKASIKQALVDKGRNPSNVFSTYADEILNIQTGMPNLCGTLTVGGTYVNNINQSGSKMGNNENGDVFLIMQGGTNANFENIAFFLQSAPSGIALATTSTATHAGNTVGCHFGCVLTGVTQKINIYADAYQTNATYDYIAVRLVVSYA